MLSNQLSRYGAISKFLPFTTGKTFFLISSSEAGAGDFLNTFPPDQQGNVRVHTTWAAVITAIQAVADNSAIIVSPRFTTAPTLAQIDAINAAGATVLQAGLNQPDGSYLVSKTAVALTATNNTLFTATGRVELLDIVGLVVTTVGANLSSAAKFQSVPTVGTTGDICATTNIQNAVVGDYLSITGTLANAMTLTRSSTNGGIFARQAASIIVPAGTIRLNISQTLTGNISFVARYRPLDPGAFLS